MTGLPRTQWVLRALYAVGLVVVLEAFSYVGIAVMRPYLDSDIRRTSDIYREQSYRIRNTLANGGSGRDAYDELFGWRYRAGFSDSANSLNSQGLRSTRSYAPVSTSPTVRIAAFGNSFVYGNEVEDEAAWPAVMEQMFPDLEVLNYGVGGYGTDQALLPYEREGADLRPHVVVIGSFAIRYSLIRYSLGISIGPPKVELGEWAVQGT